MPTVTRPLSRDASDARAVTGWPPGGTGLERGLHAVLDLVDLDGEGRDYIDRQHARCARVSRERAVDELGRGGGGQGRDDDEGVPGVICAREGRAQLEAP